MKTNFLIPVLLLLVFNSCSKQPLSSFSFLASDTITVYITGTDDEFTVISDSKYSNSVVWDFGDGRTSTESEVLLSYPKSGIYTLTLIAKNDAGESTSTKKVIVKDRVLRYIMVNYVQWDELNLTEPWPRTDIVDIYFQMQLFTDDSRNADGFYYNCPILYTSPIIENVTNDHRPPLYPSIYIPVTEKVILQKNLVKFAYGQLNDAYLFSMMARDSDGNTFRLIDNTWVGAGFGIIADDIRSNTFKVYQGGLTSYEMVCDFQL
jgi:PKD repeat protein